MPIEIKMPKLSDTMTEGVLVSWKKKPGDAVKSGDHIAEVETDKAVMPVEVFEDGQLASQVIAEGQTVPVGEIIAVIAGKGEDWKSLGGKPAAAAKAPAKKEASAGASSEPSKGAAVAVATPPAENNGGRIKASPLARKVAQQEGIDLNALNGTGPNGRIVQTDVLNAVSARRSPAAPVAAHVPAASATRENREIKVSGTRAIIAKRLVESKTTIPHFYVEMEVDTAKLSAARAALKAALPDTKVTFNDFVIKACAIALSRHPAVNASWLGDRIMQLADINIGVGVAVEHGLVVPVIRHADRLTLGQLGAEMRSLGAAAKNRTLTPAQMSGGTFTISNMGMLGVTRFQAIINPPEAAILAVGSIRQEPVVRDGQVVPGERMSLTLSLDHRAVDGAVGAAFLGEVRKLLEEPLTMIV